MAPTWTVISFLQPHQFQMLHLWYFLLLPYWLPSWGITWRSRNKGTIAIGVMIHISQLLINSPWSWVLTMETTIPLTSP